MSPSQVDIVLFHSQHPQKSLTCLVQVYGHKSAVCMHAWEAEAQVAKARSLADRWAELSRKLRLDIEIQELDDSGEYTAVEVADPEPGQGAGGVVQLRQGQQRRLCARVAPVASCGGGGGGGALPVICDSIVSVAVGSPCVRSKLQKPLDSYQVSVVILTGHKFHRDRCPGG